MSKTTNRFIHLHCQCYCDLVRDCQCEREVIFWAEIISNDSDIKAFKCKSKHRCSVFFRNRVQSSCISLYWIWTNIYLIRSVLHDPTTTTSASFVANSCFCRSRRRSGSSLHKSIWSPMFSWCVFGVSSWSTGWVWSELCCFGEVNSWLNLNGIVGSVYF